MAVLVAVAVFGIFTVVFVCPVAAIPEWGDRVALAHGVIPPSVWLIH